MNLHAILIGINEYELSPLQQCVNDVHKIEGYLNSLPKGHTTISIKKLTNKDASKINIVKAITSISDTATDDDVVLLYYSGHGAQEEASGRFSDAYTGLIECLVCYHEQNSEDEDYLLANKEIRYLFSKFKHHPHLVSVFDCCHSGDIVRAVNDTNDDSRQRKMSKVFPARAYENFVFSKEIDEDSISSQRLASILSYKNSVNISACQSSESSWEDSNGGVFTRYLLQLLNAKDSKINYLDIAKWAKISLKDVTNKKQTPTISVQGEGKIDHYSSWLGLYPEQNLDDQGQIFYNNKKGWYYNKGQLFGIKQGDKIIIHLDDGATIISNVTQVNLEDSLILDPIEIGTSLDYNKSYKVSTETIYKPLDIYILNLDKDTKAENLIKSIINTIPNTTIVKAPKASFFVTIFNQTVSISLPDQPYTPLALQIDLLDIAEGSIKKMLTYQLEALIKWNYYNTLENPDSGFTKIPIKVEARIGDDPRWIDVTNSSHDLIPIQGQYTQNGELYQTYQVKISNPSKEEIFVTALVLSSDISISSDPLDHMTKKLKPGESVMFYEHRDAPSAGWFLDRYKEIYNWKQDWLYYKFIVNSHEDLSTSIPDMNQPALPPPMTHMGNLMGSGHISNIRPGKAKWDVYTTNLNLINPTHNILGKDVLEHWDWYSNNEVVAPFINFLYTQQTQNGLSNEFVNTPNNIKGDPEINAKSLMKLKIKLGNYLDDKRRCRIFKKSKKLFPRLPVIVAEGDSWFLFPFLVKDTLDYVMERYPLRSLAAAGDELQNYRNSGQLIKEIKKEQPKYVLISGGGNDIIGPAIVDIIKSGVEPALPPKSYLNDVYDKKMKALSADYNYFFNRIHEFDCVEQVFVHGYDYVLADHNAKIIKNGWVNKYLIEKGIKRLEDRTNVIRYLIDGFNELLIEVAQKHKNATYLDMRTLVNKNEWYDEIHPNDKGFAKVAGKFLEAINQLECVPHENM